MAGHPQFAREKREEKARLNPEKKQVALDAKKTKQKKEQIAILAKLHAVNSSQQIPAQPSEIIESQDLKRKLNNRRSLQESRNWLKEPKGNWTLLIRNWRISFPRNPLQLQLMHQNPLWYLKISR